MNVIEIILSVYAVLFSAFAIFVNVGSEKDGGTRILSLITFTPMIAFGLLELFK